MTDSHEYPDMISLVGQRLRDARMARKLSQRELARRTNMSWRAIAEIEGGGSGGPQARFLKPLCETLQVSADWLLDIDTSTFPPLPSLPPTPIQDDDDESGA